MLWSSSSVDAGFPRFSPKMHRITRSLSAIAAFPPFSPNLIANTAAGVGNSVSSSDNMFDDCSAPTCRGILPSVEGESENGNFEMEGNNYYAAHNEET